MSLKVVNMAQAANDGTLQTPKMCLEDCLENDIGKRRAFKNGKKLMIVCLDDENEDEGYHVSWSQAGMSLPQMLSITEVLKAMILEQMGY